MFQSNTNNASRMAEFHIMTHTIHDNCPISIKDINVYVSKCISDQPTRTQETTF